MQSVISMVHARSMSSARIRSRSEFDGSQDEGDTDDFNIDPILRNPRPANAGPTLAASTNFLIQGRAIKRQKKFSQESDRDFEEFLRVSCFVQ